MQDPLLAAFVERLMRIAIAPAIALPDHLDAATYIDAILARFRNPAIRHRLAQIAWDGSQKLPVRLLSTIADALAANKLVDDLCLAVAAWMQFVRRQARNGVALVDPLSDVLASVGQACTGDADHDVDAFLQLDTVFAASLSRDARFTRALQAAYAALADGTPASVSQTLIAAMKRGT